MERSTNRPVIHRLYWQCNVGQIVKEGTAIGMSGSQGKVVNMYNEVSTLVRGIVKSEKIPTQCKMAKADCFAQMVELDGAILVDLKH